MASAWRRFWDRILNRTITPRAPSPPTPPEPSLARETVRSFESRDLGWDDSISDIFRRASEGRGGDDIYARTLFDTAYVKSGISAERRGLARDELARYWADEYELDFYDIFDWEGWREWYMEMA